MRDVQVNNESELDLVHNGLEGVIYEASSSMANHFSSLGVRVAGKSGTGQKTGDDDYSWFISYAPADEPKYVVVTLVEQGGFGSTSAMVGTRYVLGVIYDAPDSMAVSGGSGD